MKNRQKPTNARSGRIITAVRDNIVKYEKINLTYDEYVFWFKLDKVLLNFLEDLLCSIVYTQDEGSKYKSF